MPACLPVLQVDRILDSGHFASLEGRLPRANIADMDKYFYWDKSHPTDGGHEVLAELLASVVLRAVAEVEAEGEAAAAAAIAVTAAATAAGGGAGAAAAAGREAAPAAAAFDSHLQLWPRGSRMDGADGKQGSGKRGGVDSLPAPMIPGTTDGSTTRCAIQVRTLSQLLSCSQPDFTAVEGCLPPQAVGGPLGGARQPASACKSRLLCFGWSH